MVSVDRRVVGLTYREASRLEVERVRSLTGQDIVLLPVVGVIEIPNEGVLCIGFERETERMEGQFIRSHESGMRCYRLQTRDIIGLRIEVLHQLRS